MRNRVPLALVLLLPLLSGCPPAQPVISARERSFAEAFKVALDAGEVAYGAGDWRGARERFRDADGQYRSLARVYPSSPLKQELDHALVSERLRRLDELIAREEAQASQQPIDLPEEGWQAIIERQLESARVTWEDRGGPIEGFAAACARAARVPVAVGPGARLRIRKERLMVIDVCAQRPVGQALKALLPPGLDWRLHERTVLIDDVDRQDPAQQAKAEKLEALRRALKDTRITHRFEGASLAEARELLQALSGLSIELSQRAQDIDVRLHLNCEDLPLEVVLDRLARMTGLERKLADDGRIVLE